jgi:arylsulfatase A-like enzyme
LLDLYDEELLFLDLQIDRLLEGLDARGLLDGSLVVLTADHGELFDDGGSGLFFHGVSLRPGVNVVPLLIYGTEFEPLTSDALVSGVDVLPTIFSMVGETVPPTPDGISLAGSTRQRAYAWDPVGLGWGKEIPPMAALTDGQWKVSRECPGVARGYDLVKDPDELQAFDPSSRVETGALLGELEAQMAELHPECP